MQDADSLRSIAMLQRQSRVHSFHDNVATALLGSVTDAGEDSEVLKALEEKYDAVKDKFLADVS